MSLFKNIQQTVVIVLCFCITKTSFSQHNSLRFDHISLEQGLSQSLANCILQDRQGFIWIGTQDGLNKFDGYDFTVFKNDANDTTTISDNFIKTIAQDKFGNIWVGTEAGLNKLNPTTGKFQRIKNYEGLNISSGQINSLFIDNTKLWVGTGNVGVIQFEISNLATKFIANYSVLNYFEKSEKANPVLKVFVDSHKKVWMGTDEGLLQLDPQTKKLNSFSENTSLKIKGKNLKGIIEDKQGNIWIGGNEGLNRINKDQTVTHFIKSDQPFSLQSNFINGLYLTDDGTLWIATADAGFAEYQQSKNVFIHYDYISPLSDGLTSNRVYSIIEDFSNTFWVGTDLGINKFDRVKKNFKHFLSIPSNPATISSNEVWSLYKEKNGTVWVGTDMGLNKIENEKVTLINPASASLQKRNVYCIFQDHENKFWFGLTDGIYVLNEQNKLAKYTNSNSEFNELNKSLTRIIFEDKEHNLWFGTKDGLLVLDKNKKECFNYATQKDRKNSLSNNFVRTITYASDGNIWLGTNGGGLSKVIKNGSKINQFEFENYLFEKGNIHSLNNNKVLSICADNNDNLWIGTYGGGLNKFNITKKEFTHFTEKNGLSNNTICGVVLEKSGDKIWMSTNNGLSSFDIKKQAFQNYYKNDGLQSNEFNTGAYSIAPDGEIFFGGINGFNSFYPQAIKKNSVAPIVVLTDFQIFNKSLSEDSIKALKEQLLQKKEIVLSYKSNFFSLSFAGLHYSSPAKNQYKYKMLGLDDNWNYIGNRRQAFYTNLEPGEYIFIVTAANADGVWNTNNLEVKIKITPPFWKTLWFRITAIIVVLALLVVYIRWRLNKVEKQNKELEELVKMRTQTIELKNHEIEKHITEIENEKEKVERLLLNILPSETVEELKSKGKAKARQYRLASVMFTDFKGFTKISESLSPKELVEELDRYFIKFDEIIEKYGLEKIKTIGDAYMCAGGLPIRNKSNPVDIILAGLEIQQYIERINEEKIRAGQDPWLLRIGVHTGELIAGVVGIKRFAYDIWGDTVNIANRMESSGEVGKVNISETTYEYAKEFFVCSHRGKVEAKNKGEVAMYFVESILPELSVNNEGLKPNDNFYLHLDYVLYSSIQYKKAEQHIVKLLREKLDPNLYYHGLHHTLDVCRAAEEIAIAEGIEGEDLFVLKTAALFHDAGFVEQYHANEPIGMRMAREILPQYGFSEAHIDMIDKLIMSTQIPQSPTTHLEQIMCDADLDYLGREDFHQIAHSLFLELKAHGKINDEKQWDEIQIPFLNKHHYFTKTNIARRHAAKDKHIEEIKKRIAENKYGSNEIIK